MIKASTHNEVTRSIDITMRYCYLNNKRGRVMKFKLLLFLLSVKLKSASKKNPAFIRYIKDKTLKAQIKTADNSQGRLYIFNKGKVTSDPGVHEADFAMVWSEPETAFKVMTSGNEEASLAALTERKLVVEGNYKDFAWFSKALSIMTAKQAS